MLLHYPINAIIALIYIYALVAIYLFSDKHRRLRWLFSKPVTILALSSVCAVSIVMGLTSPEKWTVVRRILIFILMTSLGLAMVEDIFNIRKRHPGTTLSHIGIFIVLSGGLFGSGDKLRLTVTAPLEKMVGEGTADDGSEMRLPFALALRSFTLEEYPAHLHLSDTLGTQLSREYMDLENCREARLGPWTVCVDSLYDMSLPMGDSFRPMNHVGAVTSAHLTARNGDDIIRGWVSCGGFMVEARSLDLGDGQMICMPPREPQSFVSSVTVFDGQGGHRNAQVSVNHPLRVGQWRIYLASYDYTRGKWSPYCLFQCYRDPWRPVVNVGLYCLLGAALCFCVEGSMGRKKGGAK